MAQSVAGMSDCYKDALLFFKSKLKDNVQLKTGLGDKLPIAAGGFMSLTEALDIADISGNRAQMGAVVDTLCKKQDEDFFTFLKMLKDTNNGHWADALLAKAKELKRETLEGETNAARTIGLGAQGMTLDVFRETQTSGTNVEEDNDGLEKPKPQFAIITANDREQNVVKRYLKLERVCGEVYAELMGYDWKHDPFLKEMDVKITVNNPEDVYDVFTIGEVMGVHVNCTRYGPGGAQDTTSALLKKADAEKWPLKVIFVVGCCGASMSDEKKGQKNWRGTVLLSEQMEDYLDTGKKEEGGLLSKPRTYTLCGTWVNWLSEGSICQPAVQENRYKMIPVEKVGKYLSGPLVMKEADFANKRRGENCEMAGVEMEGTGVYSIVCNWAPKTEVAVVKGISDYAGSDKKKPAKSVVFGTETEEEIDDDARQDIATFHAITLVTRCVAKNARRL